ncbi:hypothetical protein FCV66_13480 [Enterovibrio norvegicus]|uniref:hypothetical protein n=1 Tax=Enterovibrio norvegicus TaxID=188144 RepID=UPI0010BE8479|nr:hypothetical protein [Enterovibrio norvegicus]TKF13378.1 hypothetical protein FCV66_13480 [Enterovibrio norvegicus]
MFSSSLLCELIEAFEQHHQDGDLSHFVQFKELGIELNDVQDVYSLWLSVADGEFVSPCDLLDYGWSFERQQHLFQSVEAFRFLVAVRNKSKDFVWPDFPYSDDSPYGEERILFAISEALRPLGLHLSRKLGERHVEYFDPDARFHLRIDLEPFQLDER